MAWCSRCRSRSHSHERLKATGGRKLTESAVQIHTDTHTRVRTLIPVVVNGPAGLPPPRSADVAPVPLVAVLL
jgi:hypothetical protein